MKAARAIPLLLLVLAGCRTKPVAPNSLDDLAHRYVGLAVELGDHDLDSLDFYVKGNSDAATYSSTSYATLHEEAVFVRDRVNRMSGDSDRKGFLLGQLESLILRIEQLQGKNRSFDEESRIFFGVVAPEDEHAATRRVIRAKLATLLGGPANKAAAYSKYETQFIVPPVLVPVVMRAALDECRAVTLTHMALPAGEHVDVTYVSHKPWSAFSRYLGGAHSVIQLNMDYPLTVDRILNLACHEGYPGHHVFNSIRDQELVQTKHREEFRVQTTFSPQSYVSEAAANYAPSLLSEQDRRHIERDILMPLAGLKALDIEQDLEVERLVDGLHTAQPAIARDYLDGRLEFVRATDSLEREALMEHAETMLLYLNEFRTYMLAYTVGSDAVQQRMEAGTPSDTERWRRYVTLMTNPVVSLPTATQR